jgi:glycosyltransferase involved in cell wall biosynthesis
MMRVLFIARYRDATMHRKVAYIAREPDVEVLAFYPRCWRDDLMVVEQMAISGKGCSVHTTPLLGPPADPHRAVFRTLTFGVRSFHPHIIHAEEEPDSLAALQIALARRLFARRARLLLHTWQNVDRPKALHVRAVMRWTLAAADAVFCANREAAALLRRWGYSCPTPPIPSIGVDTDTFRPCPPAERSAFVIGYVGRLVSEKGLDTLLTAFAHLVAHHPQRELRLEIVGGGPEEENLRVLVERMRLAGQVRFVSPLPPTEIARKLCDLDVLVLPSRSTPVWQEQLGRVLLEAMACGVPAIGSRTGAIPEVLGDAGLIFPEDNVSALAELLARLVRDPALRADLRCRGLERVQEYSQSRLAERTVAFYREILS